MKRVLLEMARIVRASVRRRDTDHPVFHGCWDWHSAVHGHWALLRVARVTGRRDLGREVASRLTAKGLAAEARRLHRHPAFETPYGRAWFLRLALESREEPLVKMGDSLADTLLDRYRRVPPHPLSAEYGSASWALVQLHEYLLFRKKEKSGLNQVKRWIRDRFVRSDDRVGLDRDRSAPEFFSLMGAWAYLVAKTQDAGTLKGFLRRHRAAFRDLKPVIPLPNAYRMDRSHLPQSHHLGMNWSRAWALKALGWEPAWRAHVRAGLAAHRRWAGDFLLYDHWIPQFAIYAMTEGT